MVGSTHYRALPVSLLLFSLCSQAGAQWRAGSPARLGLPDRTHVESVLPLQGNNILLIENTQGDLFRVEPDGEDPIFFALRDGLPGGATLDDTLPLNQKGQAGFLILNEGRIIQAALKGLNIVSGTSAADHFGKVFMLRPVLGGGAREFMALSGAPDRPEILKLLSLDGGRFRIEARGRMRLPGAALEMAVFRDPVTGEDRAQILAENQSGKIYGYLFSLDEFGLKYVKRSRPIAGTGASVSLLPCSGGANIYVLMDTLVTRKQPFVFTLLDSSLNPVTGHTPLPLYTRHYLYGCNWNAKNGAGLSLLSEDGVLRSFNEYTSRITVRGEALKLAAAPQQIGSNWYYPLRPIAKRLGLRLITKAGSSEISIAYKRQEIATALKGLKVKIGAGQAQTLSRPLLNVTATGEGVVDMESLWGLLKIPAKFDPKGPTLDLWPLTAEDTP